MIVFEVRSDGTVVSTPSLVAQGTSLSDLVVLADADYSLVTMHFTHPSGIYIPDIVFTPTHTQGRSLWQAVMPPEISRISGAVTYQIFLTSADGKTLATPTGRITVQEGVISNMPETAEELGQYSISALYQLMANFYASLEGYRQTLDGLTVKTHKWTILASDWTDSTPYQASIVFPHGNYAKPGTLILVAPADNRSREQIEKCELTVTVHDNGVIGDVPFVDTAVIVRGGKAPTEDINLVLFFIDTQGKDEPMTQWIGVDMGTGLPEVTPEDDGKVLIVNDGDWTVGALPNNLRATLHITLKASDWADGKQTVHAAEVSENCTLVVNPTEGSKDAYIASVIELTEAEVGKMVFTCVNVPTEDIEVLVHVVDPLITAEPLVVTFTAKDSEFCSCDVDRLKIKEAILANRPVRGVFIPYENNAYRYMTDRIICETQEGGILGDTTQISFIFSAEESETRRAIDIRVTCFNGDIFTYEYNPHGYWRSETEFDLTNEVNIVSAIIAGGSKTVEYAGASSLRFALHNRPVKIKYCFMPDVYVTSTILSTTGSGNGFDMDIFSVFIENAGNIMIVQFAVDDAHISYTVKQLTLTNVSL